MSERFLFTDRPEAVHGMEDDSEAGWREFQALVLGQAVPPPRAEMPRPRDWRLEDVLAIAQGHQRVCPKPDAWEALHALLCSHAGPGEALPPAPPGAAAWGRTSSQAKATCLADHLGWAAARPAALREAARYLQALREEEWHHWELPVPRVGHAAA